MNIGIYIPKKLWMSLDNYIYQIKSHLIDYDVQLLPFPTFDDLSPKIDILWDPRSGGLFPPPSNLLKVDKPMIITEHGCAPFYLPSKEFYPNFRRRMLGMIKKKKALRVWKKVDRTKIDIVTVSNFSKMEAHKYLNINENNLHSIYHGVNTNLFQPGIKKKSDDYFLHVSQYQPKKNLLRILKAYNSIKAKSKPKLIAIVPGYNNKLQMRGITIINTKVNQKDLVKYYQNAKGFIFPSLHESFGLPILEAMACGCPVITSNTTACFEISKDVAINIDPTSVQEIKKAMLKLMEDNQHISVMIEKGLKHASKFSWKRSAESHYNLFKRVISKK